jgi:SAM-dependent methyltransferase
VIAFRWRGRAAPVDAHARPWASAARSLATRLHAFPDLAAFTRDREKRADELAWQRRVELETQARSRHESVGFRCSVDGLETSFSTPPGGAAAWREGLPCEHCRLNARLRLGLSLLRHHAPGSAAARIYLTEQCSHAYAAARRLFREAIGSEFVQDEVRRGHLEPWLRDLVGDPDIEVGHEDPTALGFPTAAFDAVGSFDLLQRLPDPVPALREFARVLRPGGALVMSVPFLVAQPGTTLRARLTPDGIEHLLPPEMHDDPASGIPALCWRHFGWDLLDLLRANGFQRAWLAEAFAPDLGFFGDNKIVVALRAARLHGA